MPQIMINKMRQFPDNISIQEPVPGKVGLQRRKTAQQSDTKPDRCNADEPAQEPVGDKNKKRHPVVLDPKTLVNQGAHDLDPQQKRDDRRNRGKDARDGMEGRVIILMVHVQQGTQTRETQ